MSSSAAHRGLAQSIGSQVKRDTLAGNSELMEL